MGAMSSGAGTVAGTGRADAGRTNRRVHRGLVRVQEGHLGGAARSGHSLGDCGHKP